MRSLSRLRTVLPEICALAFVAAMLGVLIMQYTADRVPPPPLEPAPPAAEAIRTAATIIEARRAGISPGLALAVTRHEVRNADSLARGRVGEVGYFQVTPALWATRFPECYPERPLWNPERNACIGVRILRYQYERYGNWPDALRAYNGSLRLPTLGRAYLSGVAAQATDTLTLLGVR